jgi:ankyrin repeat protein
LQIARLLIEHGADRHLKEEFGNTPADTAKEEGHREMMELLECESSEFVSSRSTVRPEEPTRRQPTPQTAWARQDFHKPLQAQCSRRSRAVVDCQTCSA